MWLHWGAGQLIHTPTAAKWLTWATLGRPYKMAFNPNTQIQTIRGWLTQHDIKHLWHIKNQSQRNCQKWKSLSKRKDTQSRKKTKMKRKNKNQKKKNWKQMQRHFLPRRLIWFAQLKAIARKRDLLSTFYVLLLSYSQTFHSKLFDGTKLQWFCQVKFGKTAQN